MKTTDFSESLQGNASTGMIIPLMMGHVVLATCAACGVALPVCSWFEIPGLFSQRFQPAPYLPPRPLLLARQGSSSCNPETPASALEVASAAPLNDYSSISPPPFKSAPETSLCLRDAGDEGRAGGETRKGEGGGCWRDV